MHTHGTSIIRGGASAQRGFGQYMKAQNYIQPTLQCWEMQKGKCLEQRLKKLRKEDNTGAGGKGGETSQIGIRGKRKQADWLSKEQD